MSLAAAFAAALLLSAASAPAQTKIAKAKSIAAMVQTPDGRMFVFCGSENYRTDTMYASTDATGKSWDKPVKIPRFGAAIVGPDGNVYIAAYDDAGKYVLDALVKAKDGGWEVKRNLATILDTAPKGSILGPTISLAIQGKQLWAGCGWREDLAAGAGQKVVTNHYVLMASPPGAWKFEQQWADKEGSVAEYPSTLVAVWKGNPAIYLPQHYVASVAAFDGKIWKTMEKIFDVNKANGGWIGGSNPRVGWTGNGFLHVAQYANGNQPSDGGFFLQTLSDKGAPSFLELGGGESRPQSLTVAGNDVLVGIQSNVVQRVDDVETKYQALTILRCVPDADGKKYTKADREIVVTDSQTMKGGMAAPPTLAPGKPLPVAYLDEGKLYVTMLEIK